MVVVSVATTSLIALFMAEFGFLKLWLLLPVIAIVSVGYWFAGRYRSRLYARKKQEWLQLLLVGVLVLASVLLFFHPAEWMTASDPGLYFTIGNVIGKTGSIPINDTKLAQLRPEEHELLVRNGRVFQGFYETGRGPGQLRPSFYHMLPTWMGIFIKLFGTKGAFYVNSLFALLGVIVTYLIGRRLAGTFGGLAAATLMCFASIQIYFARIPDAEMIEQFFALALLFVLVLYFAHPQRLFPIFLGIALTCLFLSRIEGLIFIVPVVVAFVVRMFRGKYTSLDRCMLNSALLAAAIAIVYGMTLQTRYFRPKIIEAFHGFALFRWVNQRIDVAWIGLGAIVVAAVLVNAKWPSRLLARLGKATSGLVRGKRLAAVNWWRGLAALFTVLMFVGLYLLYVISPSLDQKANFTRFTWMTGGLFIFIPVAGLGFLLYRSRPEVSAYVFTLVALASALFFLLQYEVGFIPWTLRRQISNVMPLLFLGVGCLAGFLWKLRRRWWKAAAVIIAVVMLVSLIPQDTLILQDTPFANVKAEMDYIASVTPDCMVIAADSSNMTGHMFAMPLRYSYGKNTFWLQQLGAPEKLRAAVARLRSEGKQVVMMVPRGTNTLYNLTPWLRFINTNTGFWFTWRALRELSYAPPPKWTGAIWHPGFDAGLRIDFYDVLPSGSPDRTYAKAVVLSSELQAGYSKNLVDAVWVRGQPPGVMNKPDIMNVPAAISKVSAIKVPLAASNVPIRITIQADLVSPQKSDLRLIANGRNVAYIKAISGKSVIYSAVIQPADQGADFQVLMLLSSPLSPATGSSGIRPIQVRAEYQ